ncbi:response regulator [Marinobacter gelidimuriae]|uniref:response regulator n=1 Tax=Marinobacter gelidimuriae TaxID=2739064 RepID=UPI00036A202B|nr:response regulator [Marinobacter gelidimuriae]
MKKKIEILVVEDDTDQFETYQDTARDQSNNDYEIILSHQKSAEAAKLALLSSNFDGAIVDLNLSSGDPNEASGNQILEKIIESHRFPVLVVSGNLQNLADNIRDKESGFLKFYNRDVTNVEIFTYLKNAFNTGITRILGGRGQIEDWLGSIFWRHLANDFENWSPGSLDPERTLLRYTVSHLSEYLDQPDGKDSFYHDAEFYIKPPIRKYIATGDIVEKENIRYVLLSPACDIAVRDIDENGDPKINAKRVILAPLIEVSRNSFVENKIITNDDTSKHIRKIVEEIVKGNRPKYAFLPKYGDIYPSLIDLQNIHTWSFKDYLTVNRIATISTPFIKDILSQFSSYYGRQGQPDLDKKLLVWNLTNLLKG